MTKKAKTQLIAMSALILLTFGVKKFLFSFAIVEGNSMWPTYSQGDIVVLLKWFGQLSAGDIVVIRPMGTSNNLVKRLIAEGKSKVYIKDYTLFVNDRPYTESHTTPPHWDKDLYHCRFSQEFTVETKQIFLIGDNRCESFDSRYFGALNKDSIYAKVVYKFPINMKRWW